MKTLKQYLADLLGLYTAKELRYNVYLMSSYAQNQMFKLYQEKKTARGQLNMTKKRIAEYMQKVNQKKQDVFNRALKQ